MSSPSLRPFGRPACFDDIERVLTIDKLNEKLPIFTKGRDAKTIQAKDIYLCAMNTLQVKIADMTTVIDKMWLLEQYILN